MSISHLLDRERGFKSTHTLNKSITLKNVICNIYYQTSNIIRTSAGNEIVDHSDVGTAPNTSSFST